LVKSHVEPASRVAAAVRGGMRAASSPRVMRGRVGASLWRRALGAPGLPDPVRIRLAARVYESMIRAGRIEDALATSAAVAQRVHRPGKQAELRTRLVRAELATGREPKQLAAAWTAELARADAFYAAGDARAAAAALAAAMPLGFHRVLHFDRVTSPLAENPHAFLAPLRGSTAVQALAAPARATPAAVPPPDRPLRLLLATRTNANFLTEIHQRYEADPGVELRCLDLAADGLREPLTRRTGAMIEQLLTGDTPYGAAVQRWLRPHLDWADTVFIDWCVATAVLFTMLDPGQARIVVRLHSFELFSLWPHLVSFGRVDDLVVVSPHMRDAAQAVLPQLGRDGGPRLHVITNAVDLHRFARPKPEEARFTLALVGVGSVAKDPRWAVEVLRRVREHDPRYRLLLVGDELDPTASTAVRDYRDQLEHDLADLEAAGALQRLGRVHDVPAALCAVGVILSSSVRESFHCALVEGAASGAVPVVRDWPFFAGTTCGARALFPLGWMVQTPEQAAQRVLQTTATPQVWREAGAAASAHALSTWDWQVTRHHFDELLLDSARRERGGGGPR
jgi:glycosyltransferase involved in cell wall biosynthesis